MLFKILDHFKKPLKKLYQKYKFHSTPTQPDPDRVESIKAHVMFTHRSLLNTKIILGA